MFRTTDDKPTPAFKMAIEAAEKNYIIRPNDLLDISVYTNKGEVLIDPIKALPGGESINAGSATPGAGGGPVASGSPSSNTFLVAPEGTVNLPMVGVINLEGLNLSQADSTLQKAYNTYYQETFVVTKLLNKRVIYLGTGGGRVIPLTHPNMNLLEVLALAGFGGAGGGGVRQQANATNIRLIRGDMKNPGVIVINLSNVQGLMEHDLSIQHGDVIYVEPIIRPIAETIQENAPLLTIITQLLTLYFIFARTN